MIRPLLGAAVSGLTLVGLLAPSVGGQSGAPRPPVIDMHVHSTNTSPQLALERMKTLNIRYLLVSSLTTDLPGWAAALAPGQHLPALVFPCDRGRAPITGRPCFDAATDFPDVAWLRGELRAGRIRGFGEVEPQYWDRVSMPSSPQTS